MDPTPAPCTPRSARLFLMQPRSLTELTDHLSIRKFFHFMPSELSSVLTNAHPQGRVAETAAADNTANGQTLLSQTITRTVRLSLQGEMSKQAPRPGPPDPRILKQGHPDPQN